MVHLPNIAHLPKVWEKVAVPEHILGEVPEKMGVAETGKGIALPLLGKAWNVHRESWGGFFLIMTPGTDTRLFPCMKLNCHFGKVWHENQDT